MLLKLLTILFDSIIKFLKKKKILNKFIEFFILHSGFLENVWKTRKLKSFKNHIFSEQIY